MSNIPPSRNLKYPKVVGFDLVNEIGGGGFSTVFRAVNFETRAVAACKVIFTSRMTTTTRDRSNHQKEMRVHSALRHRHVLEFMNAVVVDEEKHGDRYHPGIYMLMEYAGGGDLFDKIAPDVGVDEVMAKFLFGQLVDGVEYIHSQGVCHRDLKPENLLLSITGTLKISDFGLSAVYKLKETGRTRSLTERCGSMPYVAPELAGDAAYEAEPVDVWGCGVILFTLLVGNTPWDEPTIRSPEYAAYIRGTIFGMNPWNRISEEAMEVVRGCLGINPVEDEDDPNTRWGLKRVRGSRWFLTPSQLESAGPRELAEALTANLRGSGDMDLAAPDFTSSSQSRPQYDGAPPSSQAGMDVDDDDDGYGGEENEDTIMGTAPPVSGTDEMGQSQYSQFTQTLMLFSQTQSGPRYIPQLTKFYAALSPEAFLPLLIQALENQGVKAKRAADIVPNPTSSGVQPAPTIRLRIGGHDARKLMFKGWVELEPYADRRSGFEGCFCLMKRDVGSPISWRSVFRGVCKDEGVADLVVRKGRV